MDYHLNNVINMGELSKFYMHKYKYVYKDKNNTIYLAMRDVFFPLHDYFILRGDLYTSDFKEIFNLKKDYSNV